MVQSAPGRDGHEAAGCPIVLLRCAHAGKFEAKKEPRPGPGRARRGPNRRASDGDQATAITEGTADELLARFGRYVNPGLARTFALMGLAHPEVRAQGAWIEDDEGTRYLDFGAGYGVQVLGYRHPRLVAAAIRQLEEGMALGSRVLLSAPAIDLAERLAALTPGALERSFFVNSGAEAVEAAIKFARVSTGKSGLVATEGAYHGKTIGALSVSGRPVYQTPFQPLMPGVVHVPFGDPDAIDDAVGPDTAAVIVEPIQGEGGVIVPPPGYLARVRAACDRVGARMIVDEIQTGMGRTGPLWAVEHEPGVVPDYLCAAKGLGGGIVPLGAVVGTPEATAFFDPMPLIHTSTFGGGGLAATVGAATLDLLGELDLRPRVEALGARAMARLGALRQRHPELVAAVRGRGLMMAVEVRAPGVAGMVMAGLFARHVLVAHTLNNERVLRLLPPLVISDEDLETALAAFDAAFDEAAADAAELVAEGGAADA
jgi:putrescine aminotransferase